MTRASLIASGRVPRTATILQGLVNDTDSEGRARQGAPTKRHENHFHTALAGRTVGVAGEFSVMRNRALEVCGITAARQHKQRGAARVSVRECLLATFRSMHPEYRCNLRVKSNLPAADRFFQALTAKDQRLAGGCNRATSAARPIEPRRRGCASRSVARESMNRRILLERS